MTIVLPDVGDRVRFKKKFDGGKAVEWREGVVLRLWMAIDEVSVDTVPGGSFMPAWDEWEYVEDAPSEGVQ